MYHTETANNAVAVIKSPTNVFLSMLFTSFFTVDVSPLIESYERKSNDGDSNYSYNDGYLFPDCHIFFC